MRNAGYFWAVDMCWPTGVDEGIKKHSIGFIFGPNITTFIKEIRGVNERLIITTFKFKRKICCLYQVYESQQGYSEDVKRDIWIWWKKMWIVEVRTICHTC